MTIGEFLSHLKRVRKAGDGWTACCPGHEDKNPSLSITERDGRILVNCHAQCTAEAVVSAMGLKMADLFSSSEPTGRIVATYDYHDETGKLLYQKLRYVPKSFHLRRPNGSGGWIWNLEGVRTVLYGLPEVVKAERVVIVEGEKDKQTAETLGFVSTCNPEGSNSWKPEYSESLRGKQVVVIADADAPGLAHAHELVKSLMGVAASVRLIEAMPAAKDLSEFAEKVNDPAECKRLVEALISDTAPLTPAGVAKWKPEAGFAPIELEEVMSQPENAVEWIWDGRLAAGTVSAVCSKPKVGKSTFSRNLCVAVSNGDYFLGLRTQRGLCVYCAFEERVHDVKADFKAMGPWGKGQILIHAGPAPAGGIPALADYVREKKPLLLVVDPLFRLIRADENDYAKMYAALAPLIDLARSTGTHILVNHHSTKAVKLDPVDAPLGSTAIGGAVAAVIVLKRTAKYRTIETVQRVGLDLAETVLAFDPETRKLSLAGSRAEVERRERETAILEFLKTAREPPTQRQIKDGVEGQNTTIRAALTSLVAAGRILKEGDGTKGKPFRYRNGGPMVVRDQPNSISDEKKLF